MSSVSYLGGFFHQTLQRLGRELLAVQEFVQLEDPAREPVEDEALRASLVSSCKRRHLPAVYHLFRHHIARVVDANSAVFVAKVKLTV